MTRKFMMPLLVLALSTVAGSAWADGSLKDAGPYVETRACGSGPFAGMYIGAHVGYVNHDVEVTSPGEPVADDDDDAFAGGSYSGYSWQCGRVVFGIESDFSFTNIDNDTSYPDPIFLNSSIDWFGTLRGRLGITLNETTLLYVTGGLAYANLEHRVIDPTWGFSQTDEDTEFGWTIGGGIEFVRRDRWTLRAEALYVDLGDESHSYVYAGCGFVCNARAEFEDDFVVARLGFTYKLQREEAVVPLK